MRGSRTLTATSSRSSVRETVIELVRTKKEEPNA
jgi:hypothetical protein